MMTIRTTLLASLLVLWASAASATVTFTVIGTSGTDPASMTIGDTVTVDVRIASDGTPTFGLGASAWDYDEAVADFVSGDNVDTYLHETCIPDYGCFTGLTNLAGGAAVETEISPNGNRVQIANSADLAGISGTGADDPGLDGVVAGGDAQFRITFEAIGDGDTTIQFGTGYQGDGIILAGGVNEAAVNDTVAISVPEAGQVAGSLAALGSVMALVAIRRR